MNETDILLNGDWKSRLSDNVSERSLPIIPITAYLFDNYIQIINDSPDCDITVTIIHSTTGEIVLQQTIPEAATSNFGIPVTGLTSGEYILDLTGSGNKHLQGEFDIQ